VAARLASVAAPVLLVWGAADPVFDDSFALDLAARMPHAQQHRFDGIGHLAPVEADVAGVADTWLSSLHDAPVTQGAPTSWVPTWAALDERAHEEATAFVDGATGERTSFHELHHRVMGIARGLGELGLQPGDRVAMLVPPSADLVAAVYAVWRAGGVTVIADRGLGLRGLGRAVRGARVDWVIGPPQALAAARTLRWAPGAYRIAVGPKPSMGAVATLDDLSRSAAVMPPVPAPDDPAAVLYTSGATGPAKGVRYRHHQLAAQRDALANTYGITRSDSLVAAFAPFALYGPALGIASTIPLINALTSFSNAFTIPSAIAITRTPVHQCSPTLAGRRGASRATPNPPEYRSEQIKRLSLHGRRHGRQSRQWYSSRACSGSGA
jgi:acyl-CoA synthetase (AMP-forming)/AMP-acid ligase II